jgi:branched-chain amino acid transport system permease protein
MNSSTAPSQTLQQRLSALAYTRPMAIIIAFFLIVCAILPLFANNYWLTIVISTFCVIISAFGIQFLLGYAGQMQAGHCAFMAVGAYASAILATKLGVPFWVSVPLATFMAGLFGVIVALVSMRLQGFYLVISTVAAQVVILYIIVHWVALTGGAFGMSAPAPKIGSFAFDRPNSYYYISFAALILVTYLCYNLARTNVGRSFIAIRDNSLSAEAIGVNVAWHKYVAFFIGCALAGLGGALAAHSRGVITPDGYSLMESFYYMCYIVVGGIGTITGVFFGVVFFAILYQGLALLLTAMASIFPTALSLLSPIMMLIMGVSIALFITLIPKGLAYNWIIFTAKLRIKYLSRLQPQ